MFKDTNVFSKIYDYNLTDKKEDSIRQLKELQKKMNIQLKKFYNQRHQDTLDLNKDDQTIKVLKPGRSTGDTTHEADLYFVPLQIVDEDNKLIFQPARFVLQNLKIVNKSYLFALGYISLSKPLHLHLGIDEKIFPVTELIPEGYDYPPGLRESLPPDVNPNDMITKKYFKNKLDRNTSDILLKKAQHLLLNEQIYLYCDIVKESFVDNQKVNILQTFLSEMKKSENDIRSIEFKNLIYIPLRIDEITSISIQLRDTNGEFIYYTKGRITCVVKFRPIEHI